MYIKLLKESIDDIKTMSYTPFYIYISLSNICNANCIFCNVHAEKRKLGILDVPSIINELNQMGTKYIHFMGGGEPLTEPRIFDYFQQISDLGMKIALTTNGLGFTKESIQKLPQYRINHLFLSLDSHMPELHDAFRHVQGLWEKAVSNIAALKAVLPDTKIVINHVLNRKNIADFEGMIQLKDRLPYDYINPIFIKDCPELSIEPNQMECFFEKASDFFALMQEKGIDFLYPLFDPGLDHKENYSCSFPQYSAYIDCPTGGVYPCDCTIHRDPDFYCCGNLCSATFPDIWSGFKMEQIRDVLFHSCTECKFNCDYVNCYFNQNIIKA